MYPEGGGFFCNPKLNVIENTFEEIDRVLMKLRKEDELKGKSWIISQKKTQRILEEKDTNGDPKS